MIMLLRSFENGFYLLQVATHENYELCLNLISGDIVDSSYRAVCPIQPSIAYSTAMPSGPFY